MDYTVDNKRLYEEFLPFGVVVSAKVMMENGHSKGYGNVTFSSTTEAMVAIKGMDEKILGERPVHVAPSEKRGAWALGLGVGSNVIEWIYS
ncbi:polyadenylate-binding protein 1-like [Ictalurus punctatus]|uniref:Polyadenylate-binding protein 1-like n=1 Tax=Ictalurus punctatus TaxID=7998 RepID=A0A979E2F4_ICTPU|nr:polyadenylate-binding protein 1-like [Ictalurus punctatus]